MGESWFPNEEELKESNTKKKVSKKEKLDEKEKVVGDEWKTTAKNTEVEADWDKPKQNDEFAETPKKETKSKKKANTKDDGFTDVKDEKTEPKKETKSKKKVNTKDDGFTDIKDEKTEPKKETKSKDDWFSSEKDEKKANTKDDGFIDVEDKKEDISEKIKKVVLGYNSRLLSSNRNATIISNDKLDKIVDDFKKENKVPSDEEIVKSFIDNGLLPQPKDETPKNKLSNTIIDKESLPEDNVPNNKLNNSIIKSEDLKKANKENEDIIKKAKEEQTKRQEIQAEETKQKVLKKAQEEKAKLEAEEKARIERAKLATEKKAKEEIKATEKLKEEEIAKSNEKKDKDNKEEILKKDKLNEVTVNRILPKMTVSSSDRQRLDNLTGAFWADDLTTPQIIKNCKLILSRMVDINARNSRNMSIIPILYEYENVNTTAKALYDIIYLVMELGYDISMPVVNAQTEEEKKKKILPIPTFIEHIVVESLKGDMGVSRKEEEAIITLLYDCGADFHFKKNIKDKSAYEIALKETKTGEPDKRIQKFLDKLYSRPRSNPFKE